MNGLMKVYWVFEMTVDFEKFKTMIHYIISKCESKDNIGRAVLYELLYFSDFDYYEKYEKPISGERYIRKRIGLLPVHFSAAVNELINEKKIEKISEIILNTCSSLTEPDLNLLSKDELQVIDDAINRIVIKNYFHGDIPWRLADECEALNYEAVFYREPEYSVMNYNDEIKIFCMNLSKIVK